MVTVSGYQHCVNVIMMKIWIMIVYSNYTSNKTIVHHSWKLVQPSEKRNHNESERESNVWQWLYEYHVLTSSFGAARRKVTDREYKS